MAQTTEAEATPSTEPDRLSPEPPEGLAEYQGSETAAPPADAGPTTARRSGFVPLLLGGMIAAALGAGASFYALRLSPVVSADGDSAALTERIAAQDAQIAALSETIAALPAASAPSETSTQVSETLNDIAARQQSLEAGLKDLISRMARIENAPVGAGGGTALDVAAATEAVTKAAKQAEAEAARLKAEAEATTRQAALMAATGQLAAALESGVSLQPALDLLEKSGVPAPAELIAVAQGAPTLRALREAFPPAARDALALSLRATADGGLWSRFTAFLRSQTGARSLAPVAGTDPVAILSRAEAAVVAGDLAAALNELAALPTEGQARMAEWMDLARRRQAALTALATLNAEGGQ